MAELDDLDAELRALGQTLVVAAPADDLVEQVLARLPAEPEPSRTRNRGWGRTRRRRLVAVIIALVLLGLGLTPPVRAAVVEWLRIGGVLVRTAPPVTGPSPTPSPPPTIGPTVTLAQAKALVDFPVGVPAELGPPDRVSVSTDRRVVAMDWGSGADQLHLDQFDGELSWMFLKRARERVPDHHRRRAGRRLVRHRALDRLCRPRRPRTDRAGPDRRAVPGLGTGESPGAR